MKQKGLRWVSRASGLVCFGTIVLTGICWRWIPEKIPTHYNGKGVADAWGDRASLVIVLLLMLFLLGMMKISEYYLKTGVESGNASESEKEQFSAAYPMIVWMDFVIQVMFAYIQFCSATARALGGWFLPVSMIGVFYPVVYYLFIKRKREGNGETADKKGVSVKEQKGIYKVQEEQEQGEIYRTKVDWWLGLILGGALLLPFVIWAWDFVNEGKLEWGTLIIGVIVAAFCAPLFFVRYILYSDHILVDTVIMGKARIAYKDIRGVKPTHNPLSSAAMSLDRVQIDYVRNGRHDMVLVSPVRKKEFISKLKSRAGLS